MTRDDITHNILPTTPAVTSSFIAISHVFRAQAIVFGVNKYLVGKHAIAAKRNDLVLAHPGKHIQQVGTDPLFGQSSERMELVA